MTEATEIQSAVGEFAEDFIPLLPKGALVEGMTALLKVLRFRADLESTVYDIVAPGLMTPMGLRVLTGKDVSVLQQWARVLTDVSTSAYRYEDSVDGEVSGLLENIRVRIVGLIPGDSVPEGAGAHEWTLPKEES